MTAFKKILAFAVVALVSGAANAYVVVPTCGCVPGYWAPGVYGPIWVPPVCGCY